MSVMRVGGMHMATKRVIMRLAGRRRQDIIYENESEVESILFMIQIEVQW